MRIGRDGFIERLTARFPGVTAAIDATRSGLLHPEMAVFAHATEAAMLSFDEMTVAAHFRLAGELLSEATNALDNAICVSYLELLPFDAAPWATASLPENLRRAAREMGIC